jgi:hypothetical protein
MFTAEIDEDLLDRFHVDTKTITPSISSLTRLTPPLGCV